MEDKTAVGSEKDEEKSNSVKSSSSTFNHRSSAKPMVVEHEGERYIAIPSLEKAIKDHQEALEHHELWWTNLEKRLRKYGMAVTSGFLVIAIIGLIIIKLKWTGIMFAVERMLS